MAEARRGPDPAVLLAFAAMVLLLGSNFVAVRFSNRELAPFWGGGFRFALGMFLLATIVALRRVPMPRGPAFWGAALFGALAFGGNFAFLYWGLVRTPAGTASVLFATTPLLTFLLAVAVGQ
ncbi:MAG: EamA family transporter [Methanobacteriota archaeon]